MIFFNNHEPITSLTTPPNYTLADAKGYAPFVYCPNDNPMEELGNGHLRVSSKGTP